MTNQQIWHIYLHWSGTNYAWHEPSHYHCVIGDKGKVHHLTPYDVKLDAHTFARNNNSVAFSLACMGGRGWADYPPQKAQIDAMCLEVAKLVKAQGWTRDKIDLKHIMTHAEAASLRDYPEELVRKLGKGDVPKAKSMGLPHDVYGPVSWPDGWPGGTGERWDLWMLSEHEKPGSGGDILREKIRKYYDAL